MTDPKIVDRVDHGFKDVKNRSFHIYEDKWDDGFSSFQVFECRDDEDDIDLTIDGCFDNMPTEDDIVRTYEFYYEREMTEIPS